jgi:hypothetical protein
MDLCEGGTILDMINVNGKIPLEIVKVYVAEIVNAL